MKSLLKNTVLPFLLDFGFEKVFLKFSSGNILNIFYHGVVEKDSTHIFPRHISKKKFEEHLRYFSKHFEVLSMSEALEMRKKGIVPKRKSITISFDDGYENNLKVALPILEKYKIKSTFFISTLCLEDADSLIWGDIISMVSHLEKSDFITVNGQAFARDNKNQLVNADDRRSIFEYLKPLHPEQRDAIIQELRDRYMLDRTKHFFPKEIWKLLDKSQLAALAMHPWVEIGSHGHLHYCLGLIPDENTMCDLQTSKLMLEAVVKKPVTLLAFPDGSYSENVKNIARQLGFKGLIAVNSLLPSDKNELDLMVRHGVSSTTTVSSNLMLVNYSFMKFAFC